MMDPQKTWVPSWLALALSIGAAVGLVLVQKGVDVQSESPSLHHGPMLEAMAKYYMLSEQHGKAVDAFRRALINNPRSSTTHMDLGTMLLLSGQGDILAVTAEYAEAVRLDPGNLPAVNNLAWLKATNANEKVRDPVKALELAEQAMTQTDNPGAYRTLAAALAANGRFEEAIQAAEKGLAKATEAKEASAEDLLREMVALFKEKKALSL